jgi:hypothetical protein
MLPHARFGSQNCLRAAQEQSGRSKNPSVAQRANSFFSSPTQAMGSSAGISVTRRVDLGAALALSAVLVASRGIAACSDCVGGTV